MHSLGRPVRDCSSAARAELNHLERRHREAELQPVGVEARRRRAREVREVVGPLDLSVADLGFKVVSLWLAVASARVSNVDHIARHTMSFPEDQHGKVTGIRFQYWFTKELRRPVLTSFLFIPVHSDPKVCVVSAVRLYLDRTSDTSIFITLDYICTVRSMI